MASGTFLHRFFFCFLYASDPDRTRSIQARKIFALGMMPRISQVDSADGDGSSRGRGGPDMASGTTVSSFPISLLNIVVLVNMQHTTQRPTQGQSARNMMPRTSK